MLVNGATIGDNGRLSVDIVAPYKYNAALGYAGENLIYLEGGFPVYWTNGFGFNQGKLVAEVSEGVLTDPRYNAGLAFAPTGGLYINHTLPVVGHRAGWPIAANGSVCIDSGAVDLNAFSNGFSTGFD